MINHRNALFGDDDSRIALFILWHRVAVYLLVQQDCGRTFQPATALSIRRRRILRCSNLFRCANN